jgi:4-amino-4-deoxy-L-arabinose transferase-like glycosyltransferase
MKREFKILLLIFILTLGFRLFFVFQTPYFSSEEAYFNIRHTDYINNNVEPIIDDKLSYGGRTVINSHVFHYSLAFFNIFLPHDISYKIIPALFISSLVFIVFGLAKRITKNNNASLMSAFMAGFIPVLIGTTVKSFPSFCLSYTP